jgi:hypothetical protein
MLPALSLNTQWERNNVSDHHWSCCHFKGLITRIHRELNRLNSPQINEPIKKWATELNGTFSKEEVQMAKKHMKSAHHPWP